MRVKGKEWCGWDGWCLGWMGGERYRGWRGWGMGETVLEGTEIHMSQFHPHHSINFSRVIARTP